MEKEKEGFPITSLREINTILKAQHPNIVTVRVRERDRVSFWGVNLFYWLRQASSQKKKKSNRFVFLTLH